MQQLTDLPNISRVIAGNLEKADIRTPEDLRQAGSLEAFLRIRLQADQGACLNMLYALEGAIQGVRWHSLPDETKTALKDAYRRL